ncbi:hypothetical protein H8356DRAFT_1402969 [Neocallimastix lanati (nom. inval.)]|uniref:Uncharacterized protein n=1 Tax=Neocallimastix californiae TaxID=1754190 RepID=A0A1Y2FPG8_9FUNG|nr:hypothetical protein H8356DRAFT_1067822 [Neocallimastix sp. JGI-2020a]KAG4106059.1 hypothetical protein H8356DRAFT_1402969 [Neocallimastix sp. JGI-2020a]ORY85881.1 hypothetical protein LY90DRAFT_498987 [Neocallimastix californiae]|eukprot:ORY85881.1 hypothetical protein LY90DRAFT_498987 [Neocallimastix californiae]
MESQGLLDNESYTRTFRRGQKPSRGDNQKRRIFFVFDGLIGIVGIILFGFAVLVSFKKGWSEHGIHDINSEIMTALYMCAIFSIFTSVIGGFGAYTRWKTLIVTFSILSLMCLAFNSYIVFTVMDVQKNAFRDMARAWWDVIKEDDKISIQDNNGCCGYLNIRDNAIPSTVCPKELIETYTLVGDDVKEPANVLKKDSYYKQNIDKINIKITAGNVSPVNNSNGVNTAQGADGVGGAGVVAEEEVAADEVDGVGDVGNGVGGNAGGVGNGVGGNAGGVGNGVGGNAGGVGNGVGGNAGGVGNGIGGADANAGAPTTKTTTTKNTGKTTGEIDPSVPTGCSQYLQSIVESKLKTVYMGLTGLCIAYPLGSIMGYIYWKALREFKEYDEFA